MNHLNLNDVRFSADHMHVIVDGRETCVKRRDGEQCAMQVHAEGVWTPERKDGDVLQSTTDSRVMYVRRNGEWGELPTSTGRRHFTDTEMNASVVSGSLHEVVFTP